MRAQNEWQRYINLTSVDNKPVAALDVIIPAYNAARYLPFALESLLAQDSPDWHAVLVDDGSTDNTPEVVDSYRDRFGSRLTYIRQNNRGLPAARNAAIAASAGEFLALLDADDIWLPSRVSASLEVFRNQPSTGITYSAVTLIDQSGIPFFDFVGDDRDAPGNTVSKIYTSEIHLCCPTVTFRRAAVERVGGFDETLRSTEDRDLWVRIAQHYQVVFIPKILAQYRRSPTSMSANYQRMFEAQMQFIEKHYKTPHCGFIAHRIAVSRAYRRLGEALRARKLRSKALLNSTRACIEWPFSIESLRQACACAVDCFRPRTS